MPDFFEPGVTYIADRQDWDGGLPAVFDCATVAVHPDSGEPVAAGWGNFALPSDWWRRVDYGPADWAQGWAAAECSQGEWAPRARSETADA